MELVQDEASELKSNLKLHKIQEKNLQKDINFLQDQVDIKN